MKKKIIIPLALLLAALLGGIAYLYINLRQQKQDNKDLQTLAAMDKKEMENQYEEFALQYDELKKNIRNDSLLEQVDREQRRAESLLAELKRVRTTDAAEIARLKKELATVRAVLRSYIMQVDSLQRVNSALTAENQQVKAQYSEATTQISSLQGEKQSLTKKVAIASQLDATGISLQPLNKRGKRAKRTKDVTRFLLHFTITKNITTTTGMRNIYVRVLKPTGDVLAKEGSFEYENRQLQYSAAKAIEYTGEEQSVSIYVPVNETISAGSFRADIFADGHNIGSTSLSIDR